MPKCVKSLAFIILVVGIALIASGCQSSQIAAHTDSESLQEQVQQPELCLLDVCTT